MKRALATGLLLLATLSGCSRDSVQRSGYEMLQTMEQNRCRAEVNSDCPPRENYDAYQQQRRELEESR